MVETVSVDDVEGSEPKPGITASQLVAGERMNAQHVRFDPGVVDDDPHSHTHEQVTYVERGTVTMTIDGEPHDLEAGDSVLIPGETPHSASNHGDEPAVLLDVFSPVREDLLE
jgi:quercetin dioxygenase-like cupin family protein